MEYKKDNQRETIVIEIAAWALILGIVYIIAKTFF